MCSQIFSLIIIIILVTLYQSIYKYCEQIKIYKNQYRKKNINVLIIGGTHGNEPAGTYALINFKKNARTNLSGGKKVDDLSPAASWPV